MIIIMGMTVEVTSYQDAFAHFDKDCSFEFKPSQQKSSKLLVFVSQSINGNESDY